VLPSPLSTTPRSFPTNASADIGNGVPQGKEAGSVCAAGLGAVDTCLRAGCEAHVATARQAAQTAHNRLVDVRTLNTSASPNDPFLPVANGPFGPIYTVNY
jgi:hypothetical protein